MAASSSSDSAPPAEVVYRPIEGHPGYEVSEAGVVLNPKGRVLAQRNQGGYRVIKLQTKNHLIHRLVAQAWLPPPEPEQTEVNHIDSQKLNNHVSNLEWVTPNENLDHARAAKRSTPRIRRGRVVEAISMMTGDVLRCDSIHEAARVIGVAHARITKVLNSHHSTAGYMIRDAINGVHTDEYEIWHPVSEYYGEALKTTYYVSNLGRIKGPRGLMHPCRHGDDSYYHVGIGGKDRKIPAYVHRLVALAFLGPPPNPGDVVHHIDETRDNNRLTNLCWLTRQGNMTASLGKKVMQLDDSKSILAAFDSVSAAAKAVGRASSSLAEAARKGRRCGGFYWAYAAKNGEIQTEKCANEA